jgi:hypothetical protein
MKDSSGLNSLAMDYARRAHYASIAAGVFGSFLFQIITPAAFSPQKISSKGAEPQRGETEPP